MADARRAREDADRARQEAEANNKRRAAAEAQRATWAKVLETQGRLRDGEQTSWPIKRGMYRVRMTATNNGGRVKWIGADCKASPETQAFTTTCFVADDSQLVIENPTKLGLGAATAFTLRVERKPSARGQCDPNDSECEVE
jgi:flavin-binding protein dodecin